MISFLGSKKVFLVFLPLYASLLFVYPAFLSISHYEAAIFYEDSGYLGQITRFFCSVFGQNDFALRAPFILLFLASIPLFYAVSKRVLRLEEDARLATFIFCLLPAAPLSALLVSKSSLIIFVSLLFVYLYGGGRQFLSYVLLGFASTMDGAFAILFLSLIFYAVHKRDNVLIVISIALFGFSMGVFGFNDGGKPQGYFLDTFAVYAVIFSPLLFLYFIFAIYKIKPSERPIGWYISFWALVFSLLLSFRQKIMIYDFAPFVILAVPFMLKTFFASYRIRIGKNRRVYDIGFIVAMLSLFLFFIVSFLNRPLYLVLDNKKAHFAYNYNIAKELSESLKKNGVYGVKTDDEMLSLRLKFYGISRDGDYLLSKKESSGAKKVSIVYSGVEVATFYVTKVNTI